MRDESEGCAFAYRIPDQLVRIAAPSVSVCEPGIAACGNAGEPSHAYCVYRLLQLAAQLRPRPSFSAYIVLTALD